MKMTPGGGYLFRGSLLRTITRHLGKRVPDELLHGVRTSLTKHFMYFPILLRRMPPNQKERLHSWWLMKVTAR